MTQPNTSIYEGSPGAYLTDFQPIVSPTAFIAPGACVIGAVTLGDESSVWYGAVIRGDIQRIVVGAQANVQDGAVLHVADDYPCILEDQVSVGHRAVVHACTIGAGTLVGMGAIVMDGCEIGEECVIGAGAVVTKGTKVPPGSLVIGSPGRVIRSLSNEERLGCRKLALKYVALAKRYRATPSERIACSTGWP
ncbi:MAG: gamma carbonic anhydrase family protein [Verrucomicrobiaceae bacterium]|nr:gamma carbonic anhydrase family protein [Verrucomicrobiaceae bacterium]